jgi:hypothetical protein
VVVENVGGRERLVGARLRGEGERLDGARLEDEGERLTSAGIGDRGELLTSVELRTEGSGLPVLNSGRERRRGERIRKEVRPTHRWGGEKMIVGLVGKMIRSDIVSDVSNALFRHYRFKKLHHAANWITHVCKIIMPQFQKKEIIIPRGWSCPNLQCLNGCIDGYQLPPAYNKPVL